MKSLFVILPAFNEEKVIKSVIASIKNSIKSLPVKSKVIVVNDGSKDKTAFFAKQAGALVLNHVFNRGYGAATQTGIQFANLNKADYVITFDADGQHLPQDIKKIYQALEKGNDVVIGSRFLSKNNIPASRRIILKLANMITWLFFGIKTSDSQSGFRGLNQKALKKINLVTNHMEASSELFGEIKKHRLTLKEVPISVTYTKYSQAKGQSNLNSFNILLKLIYKLFR